MMMPLIRKIDERHRQLYQIPRNGDMPIMIFHDPTHKKLEFDCRYIHQIIDNGIDGKPRRRVNL